MYKVSEFTKPVYKAGETARLIGVTTETLRNYEDSGLIKFFRSQGGHRLIEREELLRFLDSRGLLFDDTGSGKRDVIYARVSSHEQKARGDLDRQAVYILEHQDGLQNPFVLKEVGSGLNDNRPGFIRLTDLVISGKVNRLIVEHRDRLTRFQFNFIKKMFESYGCKVIVIDDADVSSQNELAADMMSLLASFSGKFYGRRSAERRKKNKE